MKPSTSAALMPASSRQALMHSKWSECVLASGRLPTLVSATPTMAYLPLMFDMKSSGHKRSRDKGYAPIGRHPMHAYNPPLPHHANISNRAENSGNLRAAGFPLVGERQLRNSNFLRTSIPGR